MQHVNDFVRKSSVSLRQLRHFRNTLKFCFKLENNHELFFPALISDVLENSALGPNN